MTIFLIVAASENNAIGKDNKLLWHLPEDLKFFKNKTWGMPVVMGRKTFEAMGKPLPGRTNIVITTNREWSAPGAVRVSNIDEGMKTAEATGAREIFITGGGEVYKQMMGIADVIYMTRIHAVIDGDTYFPVIDGNTWKLNFEKNTEPDEKHKYGMSFQTWIKKDPDPLPYA